ncbi:MAG: hypothetical protein GPJ54_22535 [Candidatus Heimdallarchaeota archaeon]|nr:hypothetical protein [Candidatus Heimdallarchaeota archaeon]
MSTELIEPSYIEIVCELKLNPTELRPPLVAILNSFLEGDVNDDIRFDGTYLVVRGSGWDALTILSKWIRESKLLDTVRRRLLKSSLGNLTAIYFNKQAAAMKKLSLVDVYDNPPLGSISFQIISDGMEYVINKFTPKTHDGHEITDDEWRLVNYRKQKRIENKKRF